MAGRKWLPQGDSPTTSGSGHELGAGALSGPWVRDSGHKRADTGAHFQTTATDPPHVVRRLVAGTNGTFIMWGPWHDPWRAMERALRIDAARKTIRPLRWVFAFLLVMVAWVIFRAENLDVAWRMYAAMFSFGDWTLSDLNKAQLTSLQIATLLLAYVVIAVYGIRQFYAQPLTGAPKAKANDQADAPQGIVHASSGTLAYSQAIDIPALATRVAVLLLFAASVLKLSAQSFSPFLYFQF